MSTEGIIVYSVKEDNYVATTSDGSCMPYDTESRKPPAIQFEAPSEIIDALREYLPQRTTRIKDRQKRTNLANIYEQFLLSSIDEDEKNSIAASAAWYRLLENYVNPKNNLDENLEAAIRKDLTNFVKDQFSDLQQLNFIPFFYSAYESTSLQSRFLKERIKNVQAKIVYEFFEPFRLLRIFYSIYNFTYVSPDAVSPINNVLKSSCPFHQLVFQMEWTIIQLYRENPQLPLWRLTDFNPPKRTSFEEYCKLISKERFIQKYSETVATVLDEKPKILESVLDTLITGEYTKDILTEAAAVSSLLLWSCQIAMLDSIDEWIACLKNDYTKLTTFYGQLDEFTGAK